MKSVKWLNLAAIVLLTAVVAAWLAGFIQQNADYPFDSDEGVHAYAALRISAYLRDGDVAGALAASLRESFYPPVHSWLLGMALLIFDATHTTVRFFSLALYALDVLLLYALGQWLARDSRWPWLAGLMASCLMLVSPPMWIVGSLVYIELLGVLFVLITFWGYWQGAAGRWWGWWAAGAGIAAHGLVKYPYWPFLLIPLPVALILNCYHARRVLFKQLAILILPSVAVASAWLLAPVTRAGLLNYIAATQDLAARAQPSLGVNLIFYLRSIAIHFAPSPLIAAGLGAALVASLLRWRDDRLWPLAIFFVWVLGSICAHGGFGPRFLTTAMPALWLMGGVWAARVASAWPGWMSRFGTDARRRIMSLAALMVIAALGITTIYGLARRVMIFPTLYKVELETDPRAMEAYRWMAEQISIAGARVGLVNDWDQMSGLALGWELTTLRATRPRRADLVTVWEIHGLPQATEENVADLMGQMRARGINYLVVYMPPGASTNRLTKTVNLMGDRLELVGQRDFPLRWYWPSKLQLRLYDGEFLDEAQLQQLLDQAGTDRSQTVYVYAFTPD